MTKGFSIEDILGSNSKRNNKGSNYQNNLRNTSWHSNPLDLSYSGEYKSSHNPLTRIMNPVQNERKVGIAFPHASKPHHSSYNSYNSYNDKPNMIIKRPTESYRPSGEGLSSNYSSYSSSLPLALHKKGQVEATRKSKPRKTQTVFSNNQISSLELEYQRNNYITTEKRNMIAADLEMSIPQVKNWFQNKRNKEKKHGNAPNRNALHLGGGFYPSLHTSGAFRPPHSRF